MSSLVRKKIGKLLELDLIQIPIVKRLRQMKSSALFSKFISHINRQEYPQGYCLRKFDHQPIHLILLIQGTIQYQIKDSTKVYTLEGPNHIILDKQIELATVLKQNTILISLNEKLMYEFFQGIIQFPQLKQKLKILFNVAYFKKVSKKQLLKLAIQLQQIVLGINTIIYHQKQISKNCYVIAEGTILLKKNNNVISLLNRNDLFGYYQSSSQIQYRQTAQVVTERAILFKINLNFFKEEKQFNQMSSYIRRLSWRSQKLQQQKNFQRKTLQLKHNNQNQKISFVQKQQLLKSFYKKQKSQENDKIFYKTIKERYQSKEQFYGARLDMIKQKRFLKYGSFQSPVVLFSFSKKKNKLKPKTSLINKSNTFYKINY